MRTHATYARTSIGINNAHQAQQLAHGKNTRFICIFAQHLYRINNTVSINNTRKIIVFCSLVFNGVCMW